MAIPMRYLLAVFAYYVASCSLRDLPVPTSNGRASTFRNSTVTTREPFD